MNSTFSQPDAPSLRDRHKAKTRDAILCAVARCLEAGGLADVSFAQIAREAGVSESTAFRYYPSKDALLEAFWQWAPQAISRHEFPSTFAELEARLVPDFARFDEREALIRGMLASPLGRQSRRGANVARQNAFYDLVDREVGPMPPAEREQLCAVVQLLYSATAWASFKDYWEMDGRQAAAASTHAIRVLLDDARRRYGAKKARNKSA
ncbi:TetR/AcrR family transcriptional regulator [Paraburkholderia atlantica]|uniref:TetR/AcrR family transcriptional regulator n=1 Tax=Paraburkholderia atlantica TaxID=2654982 RepID=UPI00161BDCF6|nr:TetR/AcrR family transcriptional regulator [Paraburkholderia atlantica]MBB5510411.1 AcrR family transcriptional regulator [Paraburkholderia atlantica]